MGPRSRRRLTAGAIGFVVIAAVVAPAVLLTRPASHTASARSASTRLGYLTYGMTPKQVRHLAGTPRTIRGNCWLYRPKNGMVGSLSTGQPGSLGARYTDVVKLCFYGGVLNTSFTHMPKLASGYGGFWSSGFRGWLPSLPSD